MRIPGELLVLGAAMRLSRLVVTDDIGRWFIREPVTRWANRHDSPLSHELNTVTPEYGWRSKLASGIDCPFCVGFWLGTVTLTTYALFGKTSLWRFAAAALTLNEVAAHLGSRLGDAGYADED